MAPIAVTHPHEIWNLGSVLGAFFEKVGINPEFKNFFDLMPQVDLDEIRRVGNDVWGFDFEKPGAVSGALDRVGNDLVWIVDDLEEDWKDSEAKHRFTKHIEIDKKHYKQAAATAQNVGQALVGFANAADESVADKLGALIGVTGAIVGAALGFVFGGGVGAIPGALVGLAVGVMFTYFSVLIPKVASALQEIHDLGNQMPPGHDA
ncbi:hypothetical protein [Actinophytocola gossypii]|uniref:Glycine zipper family protein n=1 Tax=Actinophytocola gossypii TaxID=2812003 RepID=A0ABT2JHI7_9PSEU|nr:hypothetical protein [Actinophytocola gossypii]MCT2586734.1 hypothetical protein [Actinophytocola gossypii]